jgi:hypothetical protein
VRQVGYVQGVEGSLIERILENVHSEEQERDMKKNWN